MSTTLVGSSPPTSSLKDRLNRVLSDLQLRALELDESLLRISRHEDSMGLPQLQEGEEH